MEMGVQPVDKARVLSRERARASRSLQTQELGLLSQPSLTFPGHWLCQICFPLCVWCTHEGHISSSLYCEETPRAGNLQKSPQWPGRCGCRSENRETTSSSLSESRESKQEVGRESMNPESTSQGHSSSSKVPPPRASATARTTPPTWDQVFKYPSPLGAFLIQTSTGARAGHQVSFHHLRLLASLPRDKSSLFGAAVWPVPLGFYLALLSSAGVVGTCNHGSVLLRQSHSMQPELT